MFIVRATTLTEELYSAFERLLPQLKFSYSAPSRQEIETLLGSDSSILLVVHYPDQTAPIAGFLTLIVYRVPTGVRAHIEDVVVEEALRGQGIGEALVRYALKMAREAGANGVALTANPRREAANRLYQHIGFKRWQTNLYFYEF